MMITNPSPYYPSPLRKGEREEVLERGKAPLLYLLPLPFSREGGKGDRLVNNLVFFIYIYDIINFKLSNY
jgi:hypothetical protein